MNYKKMTKIGSFCAALVLLGGTAVFVSAKESTAEAVPSASVTVMEENLGDYEDQDCVVVYFDVGTTEERKEEIGNELLAVDGVTGVGYRVFLQWRKSVERFGELYRLSFGKNGRDYPCNREHRRSETGYPELNYILFHSLFFKKKEKEGIITTILEKQPVVPRSFSPRRIPLFSCIIT